MSASEDWDPTDEGAADYGLARTLGPTTAIMITVGSVIGSGIFFKPLAISQALPGPAWILGCWVVLGLVCLCGAFAFGELGTMIPEAGGQYAFLREGWGRFVAFLYGWCLILIINTGAVAALSVAFADSLKSLVPALDGFEPLVAAAMIFGIALTNHFGVRWGAVLQNTSTFAKLGSLGVIVGAGFLFGAGHEVTIETTTAPESPGIVRGLVLASVALFWAYEGWHQLPFSAAELKNPRRDLPRGLVLGVILLIGTYVAVNAVYLHAVPHAEMRTLVEDVDVPRLAMMRIFGEGAAVWLTAAICLSVFGAANPNLMSAPRAFYAMAKDGLMFRQLTAVHSVYRTPTVSIWVQAIWSMVLVLVLQTFRDLTDYVVFAALLFYALAVAAVYTLRRKQPDRERPYRCLGYPITPAVFVLVALFVDVRTLFDATARSNALIGLGIIALGVPVYFAMERGRRAR